MWTADVLPYKLQLSVCEQQTCSLMRTRKQNGDLTAARRRAPLLLYLAEQQEEVRENRTKDNEYSSCLQSTKQTSICSADSQYRHWFWAVRGYRTFSDSGRWQNLQHKCGSINWAIDWHLSQVPNVSWDRLQPPRTQNEYSFLYVRWDRLSDFVE